MLSIARILLAITVLVFVVGLLRLWLLARRATREEQHDRTARERKGLETIYKQAGAIAAVIAVLCGFLQFMQEEQQKIDSEERTQFADSLQKLVSNDPQANLGGIAIVGQLGEVDSLRHWAMVEALTSYVRSAAARPQDALRRDGSSTDDDYLDPMVSPDVAEQQYDYASANNIQPMGRSFIPAQLAISILGTRETKYEEPKVIENVPRASVYIQRKIVQASPQWQLACSKSDVQKQIEEDWQKTKRYESNRELVQEIPDALCPDEWPTIMHRQWLDLSRSELIQADFRNLNFAGGKLSDSDFSFSSFALGKFAKVNFQRSSLIGSDMYRMDLRESDMRWADARGSHLEQADLRSASLSGANFSRADLWEADLRNAVMIATILQNVETMSGANMQGITAFRADFTNAHIAGDGHESVCMDDSYLRESSFRGADLRGVDLRHAQLQGAHLEKADLRGADLRSATLDYADIDGADLRRAKLDGASLLGTSICGADLEGVDLSRVLNLSHRQIASSETNWATITDTAPEDLELFGGSKNDGIQNRTLLRAILAALGLGDGPCSPRSRSWSERLALFAGPSRVKSLPVSCAPEGKRSESARLGERVVVH
jgi:uncharacterized protein YjbI with pentapeptide repeats